jgi:hypothetical protein
MSSPTTDLPTSIPGEINLGPGAEDALKLFEREIATYRRELPRLLAEGKAGWHVLVKADEVLGIWETQGQALQAGRELFGLEPIFVKMIDPRDQERFELLKLHLAY